MANIETWLLILTLFFPRIGLLIAWSSRQIPANSVPFVGDAFLAVLMPRLLMVIYIAGCYGTSNGWFWLHLIGFGLATMFNVVRSTTLLQEGKNPLTGQ